MDTTQTEPQNEDQLQLFDPQKEPREKVEILSVVGDQEKSWSVDKYHLMVGCSIISVVAIMGGIVWLASGAKGSSSGTPLPTGEIQFSDKQQEVRGVKDLPYPQVRQAGPLLPEKSPSKAASKTPSPTVTEGPTAAPTPTSKPSDPTATPTPTQEPTATPGSTDTPTPPPTSTP